MKSDYMTGCNYWDSKSGTEMWVNWDETSVEEDLKVLSRYGVKYLRVFPNWRDFQPIVALRSCRCQGTAYSMPGYKKPENEFGLDEVMLDRFDAFCDLADKYGMKLIPAIVTGWMSGMMYLPPALEGKNLCTDPTALMWQVRFVRGFVRRFRNRDTIIMWGLGNESNNLSVVNSREEAWMWTATIRNAIYSEDASRPVCSDMHGLACQATYGHWLIQDQGELCDMLATHPYPSPSVGGDIDPMNSLRTTMIPTAQSLYYRGIGKKNVLIEETGTFNKMVGNDERAAEFFRVNLISGWAHGLTGCIWWCAHEQLELDYPPYTWSMVERELGLLYCDRSPKPVALAMKEFDTFLEQLPLDKLPEREVDAVCVIPKDLSCAMHVAESSCILAKQAGIECEIVFCGQDLPEAKIYFVPCLDGWAPLDAGTLNSLMDKAREGACVYLSTGTGMISTFDQFTGLESLGMKNDFSWHIMEMDGAKLPFCYHKKFLLKSIGAKVLAADDDGTVIFSENRLGKGSVYFMNCPMEHMIWDKPGVFEEESTPYYKVYRKLAETAQLDPVLRTDNPLIGITRHKADEKTWICVLINYSEKTQLTQLTAKGTVTCLYGNAQELESCRWAVVKVCL